METPLRGLGAEGDLADPLTDFFGEEFVGFGSVATARTLPGRLRALTVVLGNGRRDGSVRRQIVSIRQETSCGAAASMAEPSSSSVRERGREMKCLVENIWEKKGRTEIDFVM